MVPYSLSKHHIIHQLEQDIQYQLSIDDRRNQGSSVPLLSCALSLILEFHLGEVFNAQISNLQPSITLQVKPRVCVLKFTS